MDLCCCWHTDEGPVCAPCADLNHERCEDMKYGVQAGSFTPEIHVGRISKKGDVFLDKEVATDMVVAAVGQYVQRNFSTEDGGGGMAATFPGLGINVEVKVTPLVPINTIEENPS